MNSRMIFLPSGFGVQGYAAALGGGALLQDMVAFWELEEASGNRIDAHGANDLAPTNTPGNATGIVGSAVALASASSQYLSIADNAALSMGDIDFSICAWVRFDTLPGTASIATKWTTGGNQREYMLIFQSSRFRFFTSSNGTSSTSVVANTFGAPSTGTWYFVVVWHDATANTINIQINNGTADSAAHSTGVVDLASTFYLGQAGFGGALMDGRIDQTGVWKRVLTAGEKTWLYNAGSGRSYSAISAY
jgi:hypothetical protein